MTYFQYKVGGSLETDAPTYVYRRADRDLYTGLKAREFCYVLNSRQMGKSSLRIRTIQRLQAEGIACGSIDLTGIGQKGMTSKQWYFSLIAQMARGFGLSLAPREKLTPWLQSLDSFSPLQGFEYFIDEVLLVELSGSIVIFIDEIDSILRLDFSIDDFLGFICSCYDRRAEKKIYQRLTFCFLGVATPDDLIRNRQNRPFNIGRAIDLTGFQPEEIKPLCQGLKGQACRPDRVLLAVLDWTGGQPFLTQKVCDLIQCSHQRIATGEEERVVSQIVRSKIIQNWEEQDKPIHLKHVGDRLSIAPQQMRLSLYKEILNNRTIVVANQPEYFELQLSGAVVKKGKLLQVYNRIYAEIFNLKWVAEVSDLDDRTSSTLELLDLRRVQQEISPRLISNPPTLTVPPHSIQTEETDEEQVIYKHWMYWVDRETPSTLIECFRHLFILGKNYPDKQVENALYRILMSSDSVGKFKQILYRCCLILIHHWYRDRKRRAIGDLIQVLQNPNFQGQPIALCPFAKRLQELRDCFIQSEKFKQLNRQAAFYEHKEERTESEKVPLLDLIDRYPYLDPKSLSLTHFSRVEQQEVLQVLAQRQQKFARDLRLYTQRLFHRNMSGIFVPNPTLLMDVQLVEAMKEFEGKVEGSYTYKEVSRMFVRQFKTQPSTFSDFKEKLHDYLISNIDSRYVNKKFSKRLTDKLSHTFPDQNDRPLNSILAIQTCRQLYAFLVASPHDPSSYYFLADLAMNLGSTKTIGLLLKIALLSHRVKPDLGCDLRKCFSLLFKYYENEDSQSDRMAWLLEILENFNVALATNFSKNVDLSVLKQSL